MIHTLKTRMLAEQKSFVTYERHKLVLTKKVFELDTKANFNCKMLNNM